MSCSLFTLKRRFLVDFFRCSFSLLLLILHCKENCSNRTFNVSLILITPFMPHEWNCSEMVRAMTLSFTYVYYSKTVGLFNKMCLFKFIAWHGHFRQHFVFNEYVCRIECDEFTPRQLCSIIWNVWEKHPITMILSSKTSMNRMRVNSRCLINWVASHFNSNRTYDILFLDIQNANTTKTTAKSSYWIDRFGKVLYVLNIAPWEQNQFGGNERK